MENDEDELPIEGLSKVLKCNNTKENEGKPKPDGSSNVRWIHNGHTVENDERHEGASKRVRTSLKFIFSMSNHIVGMNRINVLFV